MRPSAFLPRLGLAALCLAATSGAIAGERGFYGGHHGGLGRVGYGAPGYGYAGPYGAYGGYGFADAAVSGAYLGAPYTRLPRPNELVPPVWGYGTYGVPTTTGIRQAPTADPTVYVIDGPTPARRHATRARVLSRGSDGNWAGPAAAAGEASSGARIVSISVGNR